VKYYRWQYRSALLSKPFHETRSDGVWVTDLRSRESALADREHQWLYVVPSAALWSSCYIRSAHSAVCVLNKMTFGLNIWCGGLS